MSLRISRQKFLLSLPLASLALTSCTKSSGPEQSSAPGAKKIKVGYIGITCEAPIFVAKEHGYFDEEQVEIEMIKCEWSQFKDLLGLGEIHIVQQPVMMFLKPIEEGLDVKMTGGVHKGCLRIQALKDGPIKSVEDLRGKRIGVPGMGTPPFIFANRVMSRHKINPRNEIEWRVYPSGELGLALQKGGVDAVATTEPIGSLLLARGDIRNIADLGVDDHYKDEYCCSLMMNGKYVQTNREACAAAVRAILRGAKWVEANPHAAARMSVEKKYLASNPELNAQAIGLLRYVPSVSGGRDAIRTAAQDMVTVGMLNPKTDIAEITKNIYVEFEGVTDEWLNTLKVPTVAGGQNPADQMDRVVAELARIGPPQFAATCCARRSAYIN